MTLPRTIFLLAAAALLGAWIHGTPTIVTGACPNQLVLDYSNSCALIGQAWGQ